MIATHIMNIVIPKILKCQQKTKNYQIKAQLYVPMFAIKYFSL